MATPLTMLGQALAGGARDYANIQLERQAEDRRRAQQLEDIGAQRMYSDNVRTQERLYTLADEDRRRAQQLEDATIQTLLRAGYLSPADLKDPAKIQAAADQYAKDQAKALGRTRDLPERLQVEADRLAQRDADLEAVERSLAAKLNSPEPAPPSQAEVMNLALRLVGKPNPSREELQAVAPQAIEQIQRERLQSWYMDQQEAKAQVPLLRAERADISRNLNFMFQQGVTPNRKPPTAALASPVSAAAPRTGNPTASFMEELDRNLKTRGISTERPSAAVDLQSALQVAPPQDRQVLQQEINRQQGVDWSRTLGDPFNSAADRREAAERKLAFARSGQPVAVGATMAGPIYSTPTASDRATQIAGALIERQNAENAYNEARRRLLGVPAGAPLAPARPVNPSSLFFP